MDISFIIVNYKSKQHLKDCIDSLRAKISDLDWEVIIVNNDREELILFPELGNMHILNHRVNDGFAKACNLGASTARGDILFFLNPDTRILTDNFSEIKKCFLLRGDVGIIAPRLLTENGEAQTWSTGFEINLWGILKNNFGIISDKSLWNVSVETPAAWVSGAAMAIKKSLFENISGFDENFFMYFEDADLCKKLSSTGKIILILPEIQVVHFGGKSSTSDNQQKIAYYASQDYYFKKNTSSLQFYLLKLLRRTFLILKR
ncbi:MAG: glycosyl transferase family protein [uncultured bacterium]|nr:MAG: glycosyl transferase family protein [uncultured bacterium]